MRAVPVVLSSVVMFAATAAAAPAKAPAAAVPTAPSKAKPESEPAPRLARDTVGGHVSISLRAGYLVPFGSFASQAPQSDVLDPGWLFGADAAFGINRNVMLGLYGDFAMLGTSGASSQHDASSLAIGPFVRYHLAQGTRFDPWLSYGLGLRRTAIGDRSLTGVDWARLQIGGDWYPASAFGFGPYLDLSLGTFLASSDTLPDKAVNAHFTLGVHAVFDFPGK